MDLHYVIKKPLVTEKIMAIQAQGPMYAFSVDEKADKLVIKKAVEKIFNVHVTKVNTSIIRGKLKRVGRSQGQRSRVKKAFVQLKEGEKIELFEGV